MIKWNYLTDKAALEAIVDHSRVQACLIFKHSTRCSLSAIAKHRIENDWDFSEQDLSPFLLDLISFRDLSGLVSSEFGIQHESPQVLLIKDGKCVYTTSHLNINVAELHDNVGNLV